MAVSYPKARPNRRVDIMRSTHSRRARREGWVSLVEHWWGPVRARRAATFRRDVMRPLLIGRPDIFVSLAVVHGIQLLALGLTLAL